jgi:hypothetical protein
MKKPTDEELDQLFKSAADEYQPKFDPSAWESMQQKLELPRSSIWKRWMTYTLVGFSIFSAGVWVGNNLDETEDRVQKINFNENPEQVPAESEPIAGNYNEALRPTTQFDKSEITTTSKSPLVMALSSDNLSENPMQELVSYPIGRTEAVIEEDVGNMFVDADRNTNSDSLQVDNSMIEIVRSDSTFESEIPEPESKNKKLSHGLFGRILISPDFSSIDFGQFSSPGSNVALLLEYQFLQRWSISSGGIWALKKYTSQEATYAGYPANELQGTCQVLDVPINVSYYFKFQGKTTAFSSAGVSSYFMLSEEYTYEIQSGYYSTTYTSQVNNENNEWFKILNMSIGIQHQVKQRLYLQIEPFVKVPLDGVGEGNVELSSWGLFFGAKYKLF